jgi:DNA-binding beta-propeller fold protein YncE
VRTLDELSLTSATVLGEVPLSSSADTVVETANSVIAVGLASGRTGAVELRAGSTGSRAATVPVGGPVVDLAAGQDGNTLFVLDGGAASKSVTLINVAQQKVAGTVGVDLNTVSVVPDPAEDAVYALGGSCTITEVAVAGKHVLGSFSAGGDSCLDIAISPDGTTAYVLKGTGGVERNVSVVSLSTESVSQVLPAPANTERLVVSEDGTQLYAIVGTPAYGNVQDIALPS